MNSLSIKNKLLLLSTIVLLVIFAYSIKIADNAYALYRDSVKTYYIIDLSVKVSSVLHELQKERGVSAGHISSKSKNFTDILLNQQIQTDKRIRELKEFCAGYPTPEVAIVEKINLDSLEEIRKKIDLHSVTAETVVDFYTSLNKDIIDIISYLSTIPKDAEVKTIFSSFVVFISAKEKAGLERAILSVVFATNKFTTESFAEFSSLVSEQKTLLNLFFNTTSKEIKSEFKHLKNDPSFIEAQRIEEIARSRDKDFGIDSIYWFNTITEKIEKLKKFEDKIAHDITNITKNRISDIMKTLGILTFVTITILLITLYISYYITRGITQAYKELEIALSAVEESNKNLEKKVEEQTKDLKKQFEEIKITKQEVEEINKHARESLEYAALIQSALIPDNNKFRKYFKEYFVIWHPKDMVGGDIYLFEELRHNNECLLMVIDCTGHGVPGAFVTMLVKAIERQIVSRINNSDEVVSPAKLLSVFNSSMKHLLKQENGNSISNTGFDGQIIYYNKKENIIKVASARNEIFYYQNDELHVIKGDRHSIGYKDSDTNYQFTEHIIDTSKETTIYLSTDGYWDQNGGEKNLPFGKKRFKKMLDDIRQESMADQQEEFLYTFEAYRNGFGYNDDITVIGIKI